MNSAKQTPEKQQEAGRKAKSSNAALKPTPAQLRYLAEGMKQAGGKLPLFDRNGQEIPVKTIRSCIEKGWAEPWFQNPAKPDWLVCKLTGTGRKAVADAG